MQIGVDFASGPDRTAYSLILMQRQAEARVIHMASTLREMWAARGSAILKWRIHCYAVMYCDPLLLTWNGK
jgi:hypothetical protein